MTETELLHALAGAGVEDADHARIGALLDSLRPRRPGERPEDLLVDLGLVDDRRLALALAFRSGRPFVGLRGVRLDHRLFLYVPLSLAQRERVVPLELTGDSLVVTAATLDPDLSHVEERFPSLELTLRLSPRNEVLDALRRVGA
jgi:hypothetical protein